MMIFTIYMHKNKINNKIYIGQTCQSPQQRWKNGHGYKTCTYFNAAIQKYGWDNFEHIILEQKEMTKEEADQKEIFYIKYYDTQNPQKGYNINSGGQYSISSNAQPAAIKWMKQHPEFGLARASDMLKWQKEHPQEILEMRLQNVKKASQARKKKVRCIETNIIYESASEAARQVPKTSQSKICMVCRGQRKTCGGYHWEYINEEQKEK